VNGVTSFGSALARVAQGLAELVFPPRCYGCGRASSSPLCPTCLEAMPRVGEPGCPICGLPETSDSPRKVVTRCGACRLRKPRFDVVRSFAPYAGLVGECIRKFKYRRKKRLGVVLGQILAEHLRSHPELASLREVDQVIAVPLHRFRARLRGFNQSELLAIPVRRQLGVEASENALIRVRNNPKQVGLPFKKRWENVKGAFAVKNPEAVKGKKILLVDDVMTSGATLNECAKVLKKAGAAKVYGLTLTRQIERYPG